MPITDAQCQRCHGSGSISLGKQRSMRNGSWVSKGRFNCDCGETREVVMFIQKN